MKNSIQTSEQFEAHKEALEYLIDMENEDVQYDYSTFDFTQFLQNLAEYNGISLDEANTLFYNLEMDLQEILDSNGEIDMDERNFNDAYADMMSDMFGGEEEEWDGEEFEMDEE